MRGNVRGIDGSCLCCFIYTQQGRDSLKSNVNVRGADTTIVEGEDSAALFSEEVRS